MQVSMEAKGFLQEMVVPVNVDLPLATGIPSDYIPDQNLRLKLYRRLADIKDEESLEALKVEFNDRFGELPEMIINLLFQMSIKLRAEAAGIVSISFDSGQIVLRYPTPQNGNENGGPERNKGHLMDFGPGVRGGKNAYWLAIDKDVDWKERLLRILAMLKKAD
jgi:transcription-repair coupling factor (superfamily II helicase)